MPVGKRVEIIEHLLATVARFDAPAVESEVVVETMTPAERHATTTQIAFVDGRFLVSGGFVLGRDDVRRVLLVPRIALLRRRIDADADHLFELRDDSEVRVDQPPLGDREVTHGSR